MLQGTDAYYAPYLLAALFAFFCLQKNRTASVAPGKAVYIISAVCAFMLTLANHRLWVHPNMPDERSALFFRLYKLLIILVIFLGCFISIKNILHFIKDNRSSYPVTGNTAVAKRSYLYFAIPFLLMFIVYFTLYRMCYYPGILSVDAIDQITQIFTGEWSNHHPLCHTMLIKLFFAPALSITGNINSAVSAYVIFQIIFMCAVFSFLTLTMAQLRMPKYALVIATVWYALMPFHIMFSFTIWKDVIFGAFVTLFVIFLVRIASNLGNSIANHVGFALSSLAFCLFRSNGMFAFVIVTVCLFFAFGKNRRLVMIAAASIVVAFIIKHGVFSMMNVTQPDTVEMLSIPLQQVTRVIVDEGNITDEDRALISNILDIEQAKLKYDPGISDPIKNMIRDYGNQQFLSENKGAFFGMYLRTFIRNPLSYMLAFVDQTKGYWNSGYRYMLWYWDVESNDLGIERVITSSRINTALGEYLWLFYDDPAVRILASIGLGVWILLLAFYKNLTGKNYVALMTTVPSIAIIISLLVSTPAYSEFRYVYSLYCLMPLIIFMALSRPVIAQNIKPEDKDEDQMQ